MARGDGRLTHDLLPGEKAPQDACGVFGVWAPGEEVAKLCYFGLYALQHRGQESAGIATGDGSKVLDRLEVAPRPDHVFRLGPFQDRAAGLLVGALDGLDDLRVGDAIGGELHRIEGDLVLLDHAADAGDLGDARQALELVAQEPVLQGP